MGLRIFTFLAVLALVLQVRAQKVFAHVIVGNTYSYTEADWASDIKVAAAAGIDGFALNLGSKDTAAGYSKATLDNVFNAADDADFKLFMSFDYLAQGPWDISLVVQTLQTYSTRSSHYLENNLPLASTFEGPGNAGDWTSIKQQVPSFFVPDFSSKGPTGAASYPEVDGLLSWGAWPDGANDLSDSLDSAYVSALGGKPYMMPVSPWFYTNLPGKNWLWRGDDLWHERWQQVIDIKPTLVEILTWNDYGESHYVGPLPPAEIANQSMPAGSWYADYMPHDAWLNDLPYYIAQYKGQPMPDQSHVTIWYRLNPAGACSADGTLCNTETQGQSTTAPEDCDVDAIFFTAFVPSSVTATVHITIGDNQATSVTASSPGIFHSSIPFNGQTGTVNIWYTGSDGSSISPVACPAITTDCQNGKVNWNAWVGGS